MESHFNRLSRRANPISAAGLNFPGTSASAFGATSGAMGALGTGFVPGLPSDSSATQDLSDVKKTFQYLLGRETPNASLSEKQFAQYEGVLARTRKGPGGPQIHITPASLSQTTEAAAPQSPASDLEARPGVVQRMKRLFAAEKKSSGATQFALGGNLSSPISQFTGIL